MNYSGSLVTGARASMRTSVTVLAGILSLADDLFIEAPKPAKQESML
jgi:hypothetical protein